MITLKETLTPPLFSTHVGSHNITKSELLILGLALLLDH